MGRCDVEETELIISVMALQWHDKPLFTVTPAGWALHNSENTTCKKRDK